MRDADVRVPTRSTSKAHSMLPLRAGAKLVYRLRAYRSVIITFDEMQVDIETTVGPPGLCDLSVDAMLRRAERSTLLGFDHLIPEIQITRYPVRERLQDKLTLPNFAIGGCAPAWATKSTREFLPIAPRKQRATTLRVDCCRLHGYSRWRLIQELLVTPTVSSLRCKPFKAGSGTTTNTARRSRNDRPSARIRRYPDAPWGMERGSFVVWCRVSAESSVPSKQRRCSLFPHVRAEDTPRPRNNLRTVHARSSRCLAACGNIGPIVVASVLSRGAGIAFLYSNRSRRFIRPRQCSSSIRIRCVHWRQDGSDARVDVVFYINRTSKRSQDHLRRTAFSRRSSTISASRRPAVPRIRRNRHAAITHEDVDCAFARKDHGRAREELPLFLIKVEDTDPQLAKRLCEAISRIYIAQNLQKSVLESGDGSTLALGSSRSLPARAGERRKRPARVKEKERAPLEHTRRSQQDDPSGMQTNDGAATNTKDAQSGTLGSPHGARKITFDNVDVIPAPSSSTKRFISRSFVTTIKRALEASPANVMDDRPKPGESHPECGCRR